MFLTKWRFVINVVYHSVSVHLKQSTPGSVSGSVRTCT